MLILGARGFAREVFDVLVEHLEIEDIAFYDDVNKYDKNLVYNRIPILDNEDKVRSFFIEKGNQYTIGIGSPRLRYMLYNKFNGLGGSISSAISSKSQFGMYDIKLGEGANILPNSVISSCVEIGKCPIVYYNVVITHDCKIGDFVELSPNATLLGGVKVGDYTHIGANATILPKVEIGDNVIIGAGSVVTKDIPSDSIAYGNPAVVVKRNKKF
ncbi:MAG: acetyltransferase [Flavobacteriales bacterium]|nr:acetyltransferase [Flavobacteriales bacterium]